MSKFKPIFLRIYFSLAVAFSLKLWLCVCNLLNMFQLGFNTLVTPSVCIEGRFSWNVKLLCFELLFFFFLKNYIFGVVTFYVTLEWSNQPNFCSGGFNLYVSSFWRSLFFFIATVAMITEELPFFCFHDKHCLGNKFHHKNKPAYQSKLFLKKWRQTKNPQENSSRYLPQHNEEDCGNRVKTHQKYFFLLLLTFLR